VANLFRRILVPHDFSEHATRALKVAAGLASGRGARLSVLHVAPIYPMTGFPGVAGEGVVWFTPADIVAQEQGRLEALVRRVLGRRRSPSVTCRVVVGDPAQQILEAARNADSIVMSTQGRTGLSHVLIGSVSENVVRHSPRPVLTLRAPAVRERRRGRARGAARRGQKRA